ncbi:basic proline-rich protein-like [Hippopotamus amphibius kiboko]|uniref:basic proline-rich protein-like n=1 Tax=Hippopotamus amphibius kiboko TaxID=575201 RepID=UPI002596D431|nr:basic proline-rich protein-like [Hippopotamus amphibius kiboko]
MREGLQARDPYGAHVPPRTPGFHTHPGTDTAPLQNGPQAQAPQLAREPDRSPGLSSPSSPSAFLKDAAAGGGPGGPDAFRRGPGALEVCGRGSHACSSSEVRADVCADTPGDTPGPAQQRPPNTARAEAGPGGTRGPARRAQQPQGSGSYGSGEGARKAHSGPTRPRRRSGLEQGATPYPPPPEKLPSGGVRVLRRPCFGQALPGREKVAEEEIPATPQTPSQPRQAPQKARLQEPQRRAAPRLRRPGALGPTQPRPWRPGDPGARGGRARPAGPGTPRARARPLRARPGSRSPSLALRQGSASPGALPDGTAGRPTPADRGAGGARRQAARAAGSVPRGAARGFAAGPAPRARGARGGLPILAKLATRIQSAMMYGSWTWCHLKVTTWKPRVSPCAPPGSSSKPRARGSPPSASSSPSSSPRPGPARPAIAAAAQRPARTRMSRLPRCARRAARSRRAARGAARSRERSGGRAAVPVPARRAAFNPAAPSRPGAEPVRPRRAHTRARRSRRPSARPPARGARPAGPAGPQPSPPPRARAPRPRAPAAPRAGPQAAPRAPAAGGRGPGRPPPPARRAAPEGGPGSPRARRGGGGCPRSFLGGPPPPDLGALRPPLPPPRERALGPFRPDGLAPAPGLNALWPVLPAARLTWAGAEARTALPRLLPGDPPTPTPRPSLSASRQPLFQRFCPRPRRQAPCLQAPSIPVRCTLSAHTKPGRSSAPVATTQRPRASRPPPSPALSASCGPSDLEERQGPPRTRGPSLTPLEPPSGGPGLPEEFALRSPPPPATAGRSSQL